MTMSNISRLVEFEQEINHINNKTLQAIRIRQMALRRISQACAMLKQNSGDERARRLLLATLDRERTLIKIVRKGTKEAKEILENINRQISGGNLANLPRGPEGPLDTYIILTSMKSVLPRLIDRMNFVSDRLKIIEKRIQLGESLEEKDYGTRYLNKFYQTFQEESKIDKQIAARLNGELKTYRSLAEKLQFSTLAGVLGIWAGGIGGASLQILDQMSHDMAKINRPAEPFAMIGIIVGFAIAFMLSLSYFSLSSIEEEEKLKA